MRTSLVGRAVWPLVVLVALGGCQANIAFVGELPADPEEVPSPDAGVADVLGPEVRPIHDAKTDGTGEDRVDLQPPGEAGPIGPNARPEQLDLLFVVDNSLSMADAQAHLAVQVPGLLDKLVANQGFTDIHVGVITSSLGSHGTAACRERPEQNDRGRLLPRGEDAAASPLTWRADGANGAQFSGPVTGLQGETSRIVLGASELGCGYEETWEALYHFLIDPSPYATAEAKCEGNAAGEICNDIMPQGTDRVVLEQRAAFLRPDSFLAVVVVSNENDMSLQPVGPHWIPWAVKRSYKQLRGSDECRSIPDDFEPGILDEITKRGCRSCLTDPNMPLCTIGWPSGADDNVDSDDRNLRGFQQIQRFGYNFLYPRDRYVGAFGDPSAPAQDVEGRTTDLAGKAYANPLFGGGRTRDQVVVATIVGVPRQLVEAPDGTPLEQLDWDKIVGPVDVRDPHMIESIGMRAGIAMFSGDVRADDPSCPDGKAGCGNGGERIIRGGADLQFACIGERANPYEISSTNVDCPIDDPAESWRTNPLCSGSGKQPYFKAYPGLRHLRIARDLQDVGFVASVCNSSYDKIFTSLAQKVRRKAGR